MVKKNLIEEKSKAFALEIIKLYKKLCDEKHEYILSKQLLRSGTSVGANIAEGENGQSRADFFSKMNISLKEAAESAYWLELLFESDYIDEEDFAKLHGDCEELVRILTAITKQQKNK